MSNRPSSVPFRLVLALTLAACGGSDATTTSSWSAPSDLVVGAAHAEHLMERGDRIADVAESAMPAVVNIASTRVVHGARPGLEPFFGIPQAPQGDMRSQGLGSGVLVREDGVVLTNNHVVEGSDALEVTLSDGRRFAASIVGTDPATDLALIRLDGEPHGLPTLPLGDSDDLRLGELVLAVGNPFGLSGTVTMGIVSAVGRSSMGIVDYEDFIQTDAAINPGNSGGALVDMNGELVGINTAIFSRSGGSQGIGFAIPARIAKTIMADLLDDGKVARSWLGVSIQSLTPELAGQFGAERPEGALVSQVSPGSPAEAAGLQIGDVILGVDDDQVRTADDVRNRISLAGVGSRVSLRVLREGKERSLSAHLEALPDDLGGTGSRAEAARGPLAGVQLGGLDAATRSQLGLGADVQGVVVQGVEPGSVGAEAGLRAGDLILQADRRPVRSPEELTRMADGARGGLLLLVQRGQGRMFVLLR